MGAGTFIGPREKAKHICSFAPLAFVISTLTYSTPRCQGNRSRDKDKSRSLCTGEPWLE